jgi:acyl transferase domain-containing protein/acyl-CoA synthetase (AMP-forming)/AMP-acid ligase II/thioesterase domain-containing protein
MSILRRILAAPSPSRICVVAADGTPYSELQLQRDTFRAARFLQRMLGETPRRLIIAAANLPDVFSATAAAWLTGHVPCLASGTATASELLLFARTANAGGVVGEAAHALDHDDAFSLTWSAWREAISSESDAPFVALNRSDEAEGQVCFSSGTSGTPKGVVYRWRTLNDMLDVSARLSGARVYLSAAPLSSFTGSYLRFRLAGEHKIVLTNSFEPSRIWALVREHEVSDVFLVPSHIRALLDYGRLDELSSLRRVQVGGARAPRGWLREFAAKTGARIAIGYGSTETWHIAGRLLDEKQEPLDERFIGPIAPSASVTIRDPNSLEPLPAGVTGEIYVKSTTAASGYLDSSLSAAVFTEFGIRTKDLGWLDESGQLYLSGRDDEVILQGGTNVFPSELEAAMMQLPGVEQVAVVGMPHPFLGHEAVAVMRGPALPGDVLVGLRRLVESRRAPTRVLTCAQLPLAASGKVSSPSLREWVASGDSAIRERGRQALQNSTDLQQTVERFIREVLTEIGIDPRGAQPTTTFGDLGIDSVDTVRIASEVSRRLDIAVSPIDLYSAPTIEAFTQHICAAIEPAARAQRHPTAVSTSPEDDDRVAILGQSFRLPGEVHTPDELWNVLTTGTITATPIQRWDMSTFYAPYPGAPGKSYVHSAHLLKTAAEFDHSFFGYTAEEAVAIDPQQRLLMQLTWQALEDACIDPASIEGPRTGVFFAIGRGSYQPADHIGALPSGAAGRVAHFLNIRGPVETLDTTCSSSLVALHRAVLSLRTRECDVAIVGAVKVHVEPSGFISLSQMFAVAADGRSKTFDASADGFGRGEGAVVLVLKRGTESRDGVPPLAYVCGTAVNHDGRSLSLAAPNGVAQVEVARAALQRAKLEPGAVQFLEAHGTGTKLGDPIEVGAASEVYSQIILGSAKANFGHLEVAAGLAGVVKTIAQLQHGVVPQVAGLTTLNPALRAVDGRLTFPTKPVSLDLSRRCYAAVMAMGMTGTNACAILERSGAVAPSTQYDAVPFVCSAKDEETLKQVINAYAAALEGPAVDLAAMSKSACLGRSALPYRVAVAGSTAADIAQGLRARSSSVGLAARPSRFAFLYTGGGAQFAGMGRRLAHRFDVFKRCLEECSGWLAREREIPLLALFMEDEHAELVHAVEYMHPALFAFEYAMTTLLAKFGIFPHAVIGHSTGEIGASCAAGRLGWREGLLLAARRGVLMKQVASGGAMLAVGSTPSDARALAQQFDLDVAAHNSPTSSVLSGDEERIRLAYQHAVAHSIRASMLNVAAAAHSRLMGQVAESYADQAPAFTGGSGVDWYSTVLGQRVSDTANLGRDYFHRSMSSTVEFQQGFADALASGVDAVIEVGPHPALLPAAEEIASERGGPDVFIETSRREGEPSTVFLEALCRLFEAGVNIQWATAWAPETRLARLPAYPLKRHDLWTPGDVNGGTVEPGTHQPPATLISSFPDVQAQLRAMVEGILGKTLAADENLFDAGLDSLRVLRVLRSIRQKLNVALLPADMAEAPSLERLAQIVWRTSANRQPSPGTPNPRSPSGTAKVVQLQSGVGRVPLFCFHPSGGQITVYLQFRGGLGPTRTIYAVQSRALQGSIEYEAVPAMAVGYADEIMRRVQGPVALFGCSMGGMVSLAVARELENRGVEVAWIGLVDPPPGKGGIGESGASGASLEALAITGIANDYMASPPPMSEVIKHLHGNAVSEDLYRFAVENMLIDPTVVSDSLFRDSLALYRIHIGMVREFVPQPVAAQIHVWWADSQNAKNAASWRERTTGGLHEYHLGGDHFSIVRAPLLNRIIERLVKLP